MKYVFSLLFTLTGILSAQFTNTDVSYEYNQNQIRDDETYILDEFTSVIKNYFDITSFSHDNNDLNIPLKIHFIFEKYILVVRRNTMLLLVNLL